MQSFKKCCILTNKHKNNYTLILGNVVFFRAFLLVGNASCLLFSSIIASAGDIFLQSFTDICFACITSTHLFDMSSFSSLSQVNKGPGHKLNLHIKHCAKNLCPDFWALEWLVKIQVFWKAMLILPRLYSISCVCPPDIKQQLLFPLLLLKIEIRKVYKAFFIFIN